jgi:hypothetical protein
LVKSILLDLTPSVRSNINFYTLEVLQEHRGWKQVLADIVSAIVTLVSFFTSYLVTNRFRLFKLQTDSEKKIVELERIVKTISVG